MNPIQSVYSLLLGIVQGVTEFLPVSSSGHLAIIQSLIGGNFSENIYFAVVLHMGTLCAVLFFLRKEVWEVILMLRRPFSKDSAILQALFTGTLITALFILFFRDGIEGLFSAPMVTGIALMATGIINIGTQFLLLKNKGSLKAAGPGTGAFIGLIQGFAAIPGISRSGSTILAASICGISPQSAFNFSFLLSIPAIGGAFIIETISSEGGQQSLPVLTMVLGFLASTVAGYFSLLLLRKIVLSSKYYIFGIYAIIAGAITVILL